MNRRVLDALSVAGLSLDRARIMSEESLSIVPGLGRKAIREIRDSLPTDLVRISAVVPFPMRWVLRR